MNYPQCQPRLYRTEHGKCGPTTALRQITPYWRYIEERFKDAKLGQALRHLPSGKLAANRLWLACSLMALNLSAFICDISPAAGASGQPADPNAPLRRHAKALRRILFCVPGRITRSARQTVVHLPQDFPDFDLLNATYHAALALPGP